MKIATTIGEMYAYCRNTPAEAVRMYEGTGFRYLDYSFYNVLRGEHPFLTDAWKSLIDDAGNAAAGLGMTFVQAHSPDYNPLGNPGDTAYHEAGMKASLRSVQACGMLGIGAIVVHSGITLDYRYPMDKEGYFRANLPFYRALLEEAEKWNVKICIENSSEGNMGERYFFMTAEDMNDFISYVDHPLLGGCWDTGHGHMRGTDPCREMATLGRNFTCLHLHDNMGSRDEHIAPFFGTIDMDSVMQGLVQSGFGGYLTFESDNFLPAAPVHGSDRLKTVPLEVKRAALSLLYQIGRSCLAAYGLYEE